MLATNEKMWNILYYIFFSFPLSVICTLFGTTVSCSVIYFKSFFAKAKCTPKLFYRKSTLMSHVMKRCKRLSVALEPPFWARSGHVQTVLAAILPSRSDVQYEREYLLMKDKGVIALDWAQTSQSKRLRKTSPVLLVVPGLLGDANSFSHISYRAILKGFRPVVFNKRGQGNSHITTPRLQSHGDPLDLRQAIKYLRSKYPISRLVAVGSCTGTGLLLSYLGEYGSSAYISAAACISPSYDSERQYREGFGRVYDRLLTFQSKQRLAKHAKALSSTLDMKEVMRCKSMEELEFVVHARLAGSDSMTQYWEKNNPMREIDEISVPVMCLNSMDDPTCPKHSLPYDLFLEFPNFLLVRTDMGGHCGFYDGLELDPWGDKLAVDYLKAALEFVDKGDKSN